MFSSSNQAAFRLVVLDHFDTLEEVYTSLRILAGNWARRARAEPS